MNKIKPGQRWVWKNQAYYIVELDDNLNGKVILSFVSSFKIGEFAPLASFYNPNSHWKYLSGQDKTSV